MITITKSSRYDQWRDYVALQEVAMRRHVTCILNPQDFKAVERLIEINTLIKLHPIHDTPMSGMVLASVDGITQQEYITNGKEEEEI